MPRIERRRNRLPVGSGAALRETLERSAPRVGFLSQLIAERYHMPTQRARRQAPVAEVLLTYDAGGRIAERRLPPGYRTAIDV